MGFYVFEMKGSRVLGACGPVGEAQADKILSALLCDGREGRKESSNQTPWRMLNANVPRIDMRNLRIALELPENRPSARTTRGSDGVWIHAGDLLNAMKHSELMQGLAKAFAKKLTTMTCTCAGCSGEILAATFISAVLVSTGTTHPNDLVEPSRPEGNPAPATDESVANPAPTSETQATPEPMAATG